MVGIPLQRCDAKTEEVIDWTDEDEAKAMEDLKEGILEDPFEDYKKKPEPKKPKTETKKK